jgi:ABC-type amino acid transport substrate-binding protein
MESSLQTGAALRRDVSSLFGHGVVRWILCLVLSAPLGALANEVVRFPVPEFEGDHRYDYARQLLQLALSKSGTAYSIEPAAFPMNQERQVLELEAGRSIDVGPIPSSAEREARLLPIMIPINKGVLGWRLGLIRKGEQSSFADVRTLKDLKYVRLAQGQEWPDTTILRANGIDVITAPRYEGLFKMLVGKRFDYFPRSVMEIWDEQESNASTLEVEPHLALHYFYDAYFMVNRRNTRLAHDIESGLERAIADGSFDRLFQQYYGERLRKAHLETRTVIELRNPLMTPGTPTHRPELWYGSPRGH